MQTSELTVLTDFVEKILDVITVVALISFGLFILHVMVLSSTGL